MTTINIQPNNPGTTGLYGGRAEWRENKFLDSTSYIGDESKEIIPVFAINRLCPKNVGYGRRYRSQYTGLSSKVGIIGENHFIASPNVNEEGGWNFLGGWLREEFHAELQAHHSRTGRSRYYYSSDLGTISDTILIDLVSKAINKVAIAYTMYLNLPINYGVPDDYHLATWSNYWRYKDLMSHFLQGSGWATHGTRTYINGTNLKYLVGPHFLADITGGEFTPLICLVTKPKYIKFIRMALVLSKEIDHRLFQLWVHPEFDIPRSRWRGLRPLMRKKFLIPLYDAGIPVVEKENFLELFKNYNPPKLNSIKDYRKWLTDCSIESINYIKTILK